MPDITMCEWTDCPMKEECYRYKAKPDEPQLYFTEPPIEDWECEYFWEKDNKNTDNNEKQP